MRAILVPMHLWRLRDSLAAHDCVSERPTDGEQEVMVMAEDNYTEKRLEILTDALERISNMPCLPTEASAIRMREIAEEALRAQYTPESLGFPPEDESRPV